jgi:hypothetical protein
VLSQAGSEQRENTVDVLVHRKLVMEHAPHDPAAIEDEGDALGQGNEWPRHTIGLADLLVRVADHGKVAFGFLSKPTLDFVRVIGDANDLTAETAKLRIGGAKLRRFPRSAGGKRLREKIEHDGFSILDERR